MNYRLTISYDGTRYHGWESKKEVDTIEGKLEAVFARMTEQDVKIHGAGRTDAGVHAMGMVANGFLDTTLTPEEIKAMRIIICRMISVSGKFQVHPSGSMQDLMPKERCISIPVISGTKSRYLTGCIHGCCRNGLRMGHLTGCRI